MQVHEVINIIESVAPLSIQEGWDNSGLQIGVREAEVASVLLCIDITEAILNEAIQKNCQLIISHHPLLFRGLKTIQGATPQERCVMRAIQHGIAIYSSHTSIDCALHGVSGRMAEKLGIQSYQILSPTAEGVGLGVIGTLPQPVAFTTLLEQVKTAFHTPVIRYTQPIKQTIQTIAFCGGAGSEFAETAIQAGADVYISADFKYHEFQQALDQIAIMDIGHFESEQYTKEIFQELLLQAAPQLSVILADNDKSPIYAY